MEPKIWTANKENSYFCWSRKSWLFFLIALFILYEEQNHIVILWRFEQHFFAPNLTYCTIFEHFMGSFLTCTCFWTLKGAAKASFLIPWQQFVCAHHYTLNMQDLINYRLTMVSFSIIVLTLAQLSVVFTTVTVLKTLPIALTWIT